jgi:hypothetical protein
MLIDSYAAELSSDFEQENFHFYGTVQVAHRRCGLLETDAGRENGYLGDALGSCVQACLVRHRPPVS